MIQRTIERKTFNKQLCFHGMTQDAISKCEMHLDSARLLVHAQWIPSVLQTVKKKLSVITNNEICYILFPYL